jgi:hypothetical protein
MGAAGPHVSEGWPSKLKSWRDSQEYISQAISCFITLVAAYACKSQLDTPNAFIFPPIGMLSDSKWHTVTTGLSSAVCTRSCWTVLDCAGLMRTITPSSP